jgi:TonB family protein
MCKPHCESRSSNPRPFPAYSAGNFGFIRFEEMIQRIFMGIPGIIALLLVWAAPNIWAETGLQSFAFVNSNYIITAETAGEHSFVVNFINLTDFVIVVQPHEFIYKGASGRFYIGQVFDLEHKDVRGETHRYSASILLKSHSFVGLTIIGAFREQDRIEELSVRIGAKRYYLQAMGKTDFETFAAKIDNLDLQNSNGTAALREAEISQMGIARSTDGTSEWDRDWEGLLTPEGVNLPKIIESPEISPTSEAIRSKTYGKVKLSGIINKSGGIEELKVVKGLGHGLDQRALDALLNSWGFLPATKNGEVIDFAIQIELDFPSPEKKR